ncbi:MAG: hypothetical protein ACEQSB_06265 [Undibacterium sp.]
MKINWSVIGVGLIDLIIVFAVVRLLIACGPPPAPVAPTGDAAEMSCQAMSASGCQEGDDPNCATLIRRVQAAQLTFIDTGCLSSASTPAQVRKCGQRCSQ